MFVYLLISFLPFSFMFSLFFFFFFDTMCFFFFFFFFQAEDGIRDFHVTGVQTCALPISRWEYCPRSRPTPHGSWLASASPACGQNAARFGTTAHLLGLAEASRMGCGMDLERRETPRGRHET